MVNFRDHPPAHFHARYAGGWASFDMGSLDLLAGSLPPRVQALVREWAGAHRPDLPDRWERTGRSVPLPPIAPLE